jgi:DnaJ-class molecular chaperone
VKAKLVEETCPKCNGEGLEPEKVWCVEFCNGSPNSCYREIENKVTCKTCMGVKTITILEVTE